MNISEKGLVRFLFIYSMVITIQVAWLVLKEYQPYYLLISLMAEITAALSWAKISSEKDTK